MLQICDFKAEPGKLLRSSSFRIFQDPKTLQLLYRYLLQGIKSSMGHATNISKPWAREAMAQPELLETPAIIS